ncbi:MAG: DUF6055 domain-containing protein, partial [Anaerolineae bacterium]|nr:DUF6055 domain-containing protein [Anaerolineae bacterium]
FTESGDYSIAVADCCNRETASGIFRLLIGFNAPNVLDGSARPNGASIAVPFAATFTDVTATVVNSTAQVQELTGAVSADARFQYFDIFDAVAGETLYLYAESTEIDTAITVCDIDCVEVFAQNDDIDTASGNYNSALQFTFPADGDYSIAVADCCEEGATGSFRLLLGYGAPDVLNGTAVPNGATIAVPYQATAAIPADLTPAPITGDPQIQDFYASVAPEIEFSFFDLFGMQAGETIYLYLESDDIDPRLIVCDIDCVEIFADVDDIDAEAGNFNSALVYTFPADGDYSIAVTDCCRSDVSGVFHLTLGFNAPQVLTGTALPNGATIALPYEPTYVPVTPAAVGGSGSQVQEFVGNISSDEAFVYYDIFGAVAGQTLYLYADSNDFDTALAVCDIECVEVFAENDDISARNFNSAIEFVFPADGDYSIAVFDCCNRENSGSFRLQLGYNAPEVLRGEGIPNGAVIAAEYQPTRPEIPDVERTESASCDNLELRERPVLSGPTVTVGTENFLIHYTLQGEDATTEAFVGEVLAFVETVLEVQTQQLGWPLPPSDCGEGGDTRFDFYLSEILDEGILGFAQPENVVGDNTNSPRPEVWAAYSFLSIDNDFQGVSPPLSVMRATIAHEFHHGIQFGYDIGDATSWYYEATASWMELQTSIADEDATGYTESVFQQPDLCVGTLDEETGVRVYGEWLLIDSLAQDFGRDSIIRLWEGIADEEGMVNYYNYIAAMGGTPQSVLRHYAVRNLLRDYELGNSFPSTVRVEASINGTGIVTPSQSGVQEMSADYVLIRRRGNYTFAIDNSNLTVLVVGIDRGTGQAQVFDLGQNGTVDTTAFSNAYVIILNNNEHGAVDSCSATNWQLTVSDGSGSAATPANGESFNAQNFVPAG